MLNLKACLKCQEKTPHLKEKFSQSCCLLSISIGPKALSGERLQKVIEKVDQSFNECVLHIGDGLQRHSLLLKHLQEENADDFYDAAVEQGNQWLEENAEIYNQLHIPFKIIRWKRWISHPAFNEKKIFVENLIRKKQKYKTIFDKTADSFLERYMKYLYCQKVDTNFLRKICMNYLIEECAAFFLWPELGCEFEIYPNKRNLAMSIIYEDFVLPAYPHLLHPVWVKFKRRITRDDE